MSEPIRENDPQEGYYRRRLVRGGPWVPARIWWQDGERDAAGELISDQVLYCMVGAELRDPYAEWTWLAGQPIGEAEYNAMQQRRDVPNPHQPIDHLSIKPPF